MKQAIDKWSNREDLKSHTKAMRSGKKKSSWDMKFPDVAERKSLKIFKCDKCEYSTSMAHNLKRHVSKVHRKLSDYVQGVHKNMEILKCDKCEYVTNKANNLKQHVAAAHKDHLIDQTHKYAVEEDIKYEPDQGKIVGSSLPFEEVPAPARNGSVFYSTSDGHLYRSQHRPYLRCYHERETSDSNVYPKCRASATLKADKIILKQPHNHAPDTSLIRKFKRRYTSTYSYY